MMIRRFSLAPGLPPRELAAVRLIFVFMVLTVLYVVLRFQFGQPTLAAGAQVSVLAFIAWLGVRGLISGRFKLNNSVDVVLLVFLSHAIVFSGFVVLRDGLYGAGWAVMTSVLPLLVYFYVRNTLTPHGARQVLLLLEFVLLVVAIISIAEFVNLNILNQGFFTYSFELREHITNRATLLGEEASLYMGQFEGASYTLIRMPGPLSHVNATGLALAVGLVVAITRYLSTRESMKALPFVLVFALALFLGGGRASMVAGAAGVVVAVLIIRRISPAKVVSRVRLLVITGVLSLGALVIANVIDLVAFGNLFSVGGGVRAVSRLLTTDAVHQFGDQLVGNPLVLITGVGPTSPAMVKDPFITPVLSDELFIISLLSRYGVVLPTLAVAAVVGTVLTTLRGGRRRQDTLFQTLLGASFGGIVVFWVSGFHTAAMMRPQLFPIMLVLVAIISIVGRASDRDSRGRRVG